MKFSLLKFRAGMPLYHATYVNTEIIREELRSGDERDLQILAALEKRPDGAFLDDRMHGKYFSLLPETGISYGGHYEGLIPIRYKTKRKMVLADFVMSGTKTAAALLRWMVSCGLDKKIDGFIDHQDIIREVYLFRPYEVLRDEPAEAYASKEEIRRVMAIDAGFETFDEQEIEQLGKYLVECRTFDVDPKDCNPRGHSRDCGAVQIIRSRQETSELTRGEYEIPDWSLLGKYK